MNPLKTEMWAVSSHYTSLCCFTELIVFTMESYVNNLNVGITYNIRVGSTIEQYTLKNLKYHKYTTHCLPYAIAL